MIFRAANFIKFDIKMKSSYKKVIVMAKVCWLLNGLLWYEKAFK